MDSTTASYRGHRFPPEIISHAVWLYYRFCLSFRDVEDLLAERGASLSLRRRTDRFDNGANRATGNTRFVWWRTSDFSHEGSQLAHGGN